MPNDGTTSHNPTWFAFIALCTNLTLQVNFSGCTDNQPGPGICAGLQAAVYSDCNDYYGSVVGCSTTGQCNSTSGTRVVSMTGLIIGATYYFLVDGCCGSACTNISIDVVGTCGSPGIDPWPDGPNSIVGETEVCVGSTHQYDIDIPIGGVKFYGNLVHFLHIGLFMMYHNIQVERQVFLLV
ncbi:MAG: hypothetical protein IPO94_19970 [Saprospiraceae bacterium]|nr:hypothetical protein [Saprospiraceae bacterium]